eukprot:GHVP01066349.1.p1 GENE.GHVP01066349.1~~GHVP01066349.1.p1  ORF type:complete len:499 (+),score=102.72 GHVP01066349.1:990-2486(+)
MTGKKRKGDSPEINRTPPASRLVQGEENLESYDEIDSDETSSDGDSQFSDDQDIEVENSEELENENLEEENEGDVTLFRPGHDTVSEGEELDFEESAYNLLQQFEAGWACPTFDFIPLFASPLSSSKFPYTLHIVAGTQSDDAETNNVCVVRLGNLHRTRSLGLSGEVLDEDDEEEYSSPDFYISKFKHQGAINRLRVCPQIPRLVATWSELGKVYFWDIGAHQKKVDEITAGAILPEVMKPLHIFGGHKDEGYAMDWNPHAEGRFLTGGRDNRIVLFDPEEGGSWETRNIDCTEKSKKKEHPWVECVQWKKTGAGAKDVFAYCGTDLCVNVVDVRMAKSGVLQTAPSRIMNAHTCDINTLSWNFADENNIATGDDIGNIRIWDIRRAKEPTDFYASFDFHQKAISNVDWHRSEQQQFIASSYDEQVATLWDVSVENQGAEEIRDSEGRIVPPQILFTHYSGQECTEAKFHPDFQTPLVVSTGIKGFDIFEPNIETKE